MNKTIVIIGVGNFLMGDEGAGIHAIKILDGLDWPENIEIIDAGVPSLSLLHMIENRDLAIIIDCADFGGKPGDIEAFSLDKIKTDLNNKEISLHATDLLSVFRIAIETKIELPDVWIIGIQPKKIEMTTDLSDEARLALKKLPEIVNNLLKSHNL